MARIEFRNDNTRATEETEGSDGRLNVSSRSDGRPYYNSRDAGQCYTIVYEHSDAVDDQYAFVMTNTSTDKTLVVSSVGINSDKLVRVQLAYISGAVAQGVSVIPTNLNADSSNDAQASVVHDGGGTAITVGTLGALIDDVNVGIHGHEELRLSDRLRLGQNDSIALLLKTGSTPLLTGVVFFYFE